MRGDFKRLSGALKKNIYCKIGLGLLFLTVFVLMCCFMKYLVFSLAPAAFAMFLLMDGVGMLFRCLSGEYVEIEGVCKEVQRSRLRRKAKCILIETRRGVLRLPVKMKPKTVKVGDKVTIYVPDHASVYDHKGDLVVCEFYAIEIEKGEK